MWTLFPGAIFVRDCVFGVLSVYGGSRQSALVDYSIESICTDGLFVYEM